MILLHDQTCLYLKLIGCFPNVQLPSNHEKADTKWLPWQLKHYMQNFSQSEISQNLSKLTKISVGNGSSSAICENLLLGNSSIFVKKLRCLGVLGTQVYVLRKFIFVNFLILANVLDLKGQIMEMFLNNCTDLMCIIQCYLSLIFTKRLKFYAITIFVNIQDLTPFFYIREAITMLLFDQLLAILTFPFWQSLFFINSSIALQSTMYCTKNEVFH